MPLEICIPLHSAAHCAHHFHICILHISPLVVDMFMLFVSFLYIPIFLWHRCLHHYTKTKKKKKTTKEKKTGNKHDSDSDKGARIRACWFETFSVVTNCFHV